MKVADGYSVLVMKPEDYVQVFFEHNAEILFVCFDINISDFQCKRCHSQITLPQF